MTSRPKPRRDKAHLRFVPATGLFFETQLCRSPPLLTGCRCSLNSRHDITTRWVHEDNFVVVELGILLVFERADLIFQVAGQLLEAHGTGKLLSNSGSESAWHRLTRLSRKILLDHLPLLLSQIDLSGSGHADAEGQSDY